MPAARAAGLPDTSTMNVLFIAIEDCTATALGCYGNSICRTPNLDRLAASGVRFEAAYCQGVACNPSRASFLTGLRPSTTGVFTNRQPMAERLPPGTPTLPELIKGRGLYAANVGKLFYDPEDTPAVAVFDRIELCKAPAGWEGPDPILTFPPLPAELGPPPPPNDDRSSPEWREWQRDRFDRWGPSGRTVEQEPDAQVARVASALLREFATSRRQFFLSVGSVRPHLPLICPLEYIEMYDPARMTVPPASPEESQDLSAAVWSPASTFKPRPDQAQEVIAAYYSCVTFLDRQLGMVLSTLEETGLADRTIVIFLADHGFHLGERGLWGKYTLLEPTTRVPLIVRVPGAPANGQVSREIVELVDLLPTLGELIGLDLPDDLEGTSFAPLLVDPARPWKKAAFSESGWSGREQTMRTLRYRYTERKARGQVTAELYDHATDPGETTNLAHDPAYQAAEEQLADLLRGRWMGAAPDRPR